MKAAVAQPCKQGIVHHLSHYVRFLPPNVQIIMFGLVIFLEMLALVKKQFGTLA
jgi:hypothetical protein